MNKDYSLLVCWRAPDIMPEEGTVILSFLSPAKEEELKRKFKGKIISARQIAPEVRGRANKIYVDLIAKIAASPVKGGKTLREALKKNDALSLWWFHKVSNKASESDPTFQFIVEILSIISVASSANRKKIILLGGYRELAKVLKDIFQIQEIKCRRRYSFLYVFVRSLLSRAKYFFIFLLRWFIVKTNVKAPQSSFDVVFGGFWDWSIQEDKHTHRLNDCYFKSLPDRLSSKGLKTGWFLWFDPYVGSFSKRRKLKHILEPIKKHSNSLVILQCLIKIRQLIKAIANFRPYWIFLSFSRNNNFKKTFVVEGINFYPLLWGPLSYYFLNSSIPHFELVYIGSLEAFKKYQPKISISFLELFLHSRAFYAGAKGGSSNTTNCLIQHASYSREKTLGVLDPQREYEGFPDKCSIPKPDYIFAMGELGKEIFMESGFPENRIFLTGSSRYEHVTDTNVLRDSKSSKIKNLFMMPTVDRDLEMGMIEAACMATEDLEGVRLFLRSHPFAKMEKHPDFAHYRDRIEITKGTLEEDLSKADLIIFSYSTVAEEALVRGVPVWQWVPISYNASVFCDLKVIPAFHSVVELRQSLKEFISNSGLFIPSDETKTFVLKKCFCTTGENVCERIADHMVKDFFNGKCN